MTVESDGRADAQHELGPLQQRVLEYVWGHPGCTARDCVDSFNAAGSDYAYTTIKTVCEVLARKRLVSRKNLRNTYVYAPLKSRGWLLMQGISELLGRFAGGPRPVSAHLVDALEHDNPEELARLIAELKSRGHI